jgi:antitoxin YefM
MESIYQLKTSELDEKFLQAVKTLFKDKNIIVTISTFDETDYLLQTKSNRDHLLKSLKMVKNKKNLIKFDSIEELEKTIQKGIENNHNK